jgi:hypothetical protein
MSMWWCVSVCVCDTVRGARVEGGLLGLRDLLHLAVQLRGRGLEGQDVHAQKKIKRTESELGGLNTRHGVDQSELKKHGVE